MDREFVFTVLMLVLVGSTLLLSAAPPDAADPAGDAEERERRCWRRIWAPLIPATVMLAALLGWLVLEPDPAERLPRLLMVAALPFSAIWARAVWRATAALLTGPSDVAAVTLGMARPRVLISPRFARAVDERALDAACAHEDAHACHRDPLRLWAAQLASDLQWPLPAARARLDRWRRAVELVRDDEARRSGVEGADLAAAILAAVRVQAADARPAACLCDAAFLKERITRLLAPLEPRGAAMAASVRRLRPMSALLVAWGLATLLGAQFGESIVRALLHAV